MFDVIIKNGIVIDGSGSKGVNSDIGIKKDKITSIESKINANSAETIDASGKIVCPGFIDILDHSDSFWTLFFIPRLDSKVMQGITTIIGGNCGSSLFPVTGEDSINSIRKWVDIGNVNINWSRTKEFFYELSKRELGLNFGSLVGHETIRRGLLKDNTRKITKEEIKIMGGMLEESIKSGALGMSTGLVFSHAKMTTDDEIRYLAQVLKFNDSIYASHIRGEAEELIPSINETIQIGREMEISVEISHLKALGKKYWPDMKKVLDMIDVVNEEGFDISFDIYPYDTTGSVLYILLPDWISQGGRKKMISRLKNLDMRGRIINDMKEMQCNYENIVVSICPKLKEMTGKKISAIAEDQEISAEEAVIELLISSNGHVIVFNKGILSEENIAIALENKHCIVSSGDAAYNTEYVRTGELVHPRCFGSFSRIFRKYVIEKKVLSVENAIEKMTSKPALKMKIKNRGLLKKGYYADVVVFDLNKITDKADFKNPYQYSEGIEYVFINGKKVVEKGKHTGELAGKVLRK